MPQILIVTAIPVFSVLAALALSVAGQPAPPSDAATVTVLVPPWRTAEAVVTLAGGVALPVPGTPLARVAAGAGPDFAERLRAAGAWAVLPSDSTSFLCGD